MRLALPAGGWMGTYQYVDGDNLEVVWVACYSTMQDDDSAIKYMERVAFMFKGPPIRCLYIERKNDRDGRTWTTLPVKFEKLESDKPDLFDYWDWFWRTPEGDWERGKD